MAPIPLLSGFGFDQVAQDFYDTYGQHFNNLAWWVLRCGRRVGGVLYLADNLLEKVHNDRGLAQHYCHTAYELPRLCDQDTERPAGGAQLGDTLVPSVDTTIFKLQCDG